MKSLFKNYKPLKNVLSHLLTWAGILSVIYFLQHSTGNQQRPDHFMERMQLHLFVTVAVLAVCYYFFLS